MRTTVRRLALVAAPTLLALPILPAAASSPDAVGAAQAPQAAAAAPDCGTSSAIQQKMRGGGTWRMCWHTTSTSGLVLEDVSFQPKRSSRPIDVLRSGRIAQVHVPYDNAAAEYNDVTDIRLGETPEPLRRKDCPGGVLKKIPRVGLEDGETKLVNGLCVTTQERGFAFHGNSEDVGENTHHKDAEQGQDLVVYTINSAGYYHYINQWNFSDDGTLTPKAGATGNLSPGDYDATDGKGWPIGKGERANAASHHHNIFWRLDFHPDGAPAGRVEQYDTKRTGSGGGPDNTPTYKTTRKTLTKELAGNTGSARNRWWRVVSGQGKNGDGHPRSWELVHPNGNKYTGRSFTAYDMYFTTYKKTEQYASDNSRFGSNRPSNVRKFVDGEALKHPIAWVNVGFHHVARDEDQTPMPVHWQGFQIVPRDVTAMSPLTPDRLHKSKYNGVPDW